MRIKVVIPAQAGIQSFLVMTVLAFCLFLSPASLFAEQMGAMRVMGDFTANTMVRVPISTTTITAPDSYTKLLIHGDAIADATGKTVTNTEAYDSYSKLMLHLENNVTDSATSKSVTNNNVTFSSSVYKMGSYSGVFNGSNAYLSLADSADWNFGSGAFTIDFWVRFNTLPSSGSYMTFVSQSGGAYDSWFAVYNSSGTYLWYALFQDPGGSGEVNTSFASPGLSTGTWYHVALVRTGNTIKVFQDGSQCGSDYSYSASTGDFTSAYVIGCRIINGPSYSRYFNGWLDEVRITKGVARWTSNFTPPSTPYGTVGVTTSQYKFSDLGRSLEFKASGDYLSLADSADWDWGTGNGTIDFWVRFASIASAQGIYEQKQNESNYVVLNWQTDNKLRWYCIIGGTWMFNYSFAFTPSANTWYHIALVRNGTTMDCYIDGTAATKTETTAVGTNDLSGITGSLTIGYEASHAWYTNGWIDEFRWSKGVCRWTSNFTPPTAPYDGARTVINITGLDGNTDEEYELICMVVGNANGGLRLCPNNDTTNTNYGYQNIEANSTSVSALRSTSGLTGIYLGYVQSGYCLLSDTTLYAKSGYVRTALTNVADRITGTTVSILDSLGGVWNNTTGNITSLAIMSTQANALGVGTVIELYKKVPKQ